MKEEAELLKGEARRERAIENERLKEIKSC